MRSKGRNVERNKETLGGKEWKICLELMHSVDLVIEQKYI